jgi:protein O-mannosyl-transferase
MLDVELFGPWPGPHHLVNAGFHAANAVILFLVLRAATSAFWPSAFVAALFAVHPLNVESVAWISQRKSVLSTLFLLLSVGAYVSWTRRRGFGRYLAAAVLLGLGLLAKPMLVSTPLLFLILDFWPLARGRPRLLEKLPFFALAAAASAATVLAQSKWNAVAAVANYSLGARVSNALVSCVAYLRDVVWPARLACFYPHPASLGRGTGILATAGSAILLTAITVVAIAARKARPWFLFGWSWYLVSLAPVAGLMQVGSQARADRYAYVPMIGIFVAVVWELASRVPKTAAAPRAAAAAASLVLASFAAAAFVQAGTWRNAESLYRHALAVTRDNWLASNNLGNFWLAQSDPERALGAFRQAAAMKPDYEMAYYNEGVALTALSRPEEAIRAYRENLRLNPSNADGWVNLGYALINLGQSREGLQACERALSIRPDDPIALHGAAVARATLGDSRGALEYLARLERLDPARATQLRRDLEAAR